MGSLVARIVDPGDPLYHHRLLPGAATRVVLRGRATPVKAWRVVIDDTTAHGAFCVYARLRVGGLVTVASSEILPCAIR